MELRVAVTVKVPSNSIISCLLVLSMYVVHFELRHPISISLPFGTREEKEKKKVEPTVPD